MYIPTIFLGAQGGCIDCIISGSALPTGVTVGNLVSGSQKYFWIKVEGGSSVEFDIEGSITNEAKLLLVGGGGYKDSLLPINNTFGGGAAGSVVWQDISLQPNRYFLSASIGGTSTNNTGGAAQFIVPFNEPDPIKRTLIFANGGGPNQLTSDGGDNDNFSGGEGKFPSYAGGGGAGSTSNGQNGVGTTGGDGGSGSYIPEPFNDVVGYDWVAQGGPGDGNIVGQFPNGDNGAYGNGGSTSNNSSENGKNGVAVLFIPITGCTTSSVEGEDFFAVGGTEGTFFSGSVQYKYHAFTQSGKSNLLHVLSGYTSEAKTLIVGGGAGSSTTKDTTSDGTTDFCFQSGGGAGAGGVRFSDNVKLFGPNNLAYVPSGGTRYSNGENGNLKTTYISDTNITAGGGGRGSYRNTAFNPVQGNANNGGSGGGGYSNVDFTGGTATGVGIGNNGGDGATGLRPYAGGGGGGAGSAGAGGGTWVGGDSWAPGGSGYDLAGTFWSFLTGSVYTSRSDIAIGGSGSYGLISANLSPSPPCGATPIGGFNGSQANDGSGANPIDNGQGNSGIVVIAYPISGSVTNS